MSTVQNINRTVDNFNGGLPARKDLAPAIVFSVLLGLSLPLLIWRLVSKKHRSKILINGLLFFILRLASLIMRAYMSRHQYSEGTLVGEAVLTSIGYLPLLNALIDLWQARAEKGDERVYDDVTAAHQAKKMKWVKLTGWFLRGALLASLGTAIAAGAIFRKHYSEQEQTSLIRNLLKASYIVSLAITVITMLLKAVSAIMNHEPLLKTALLYSYSIPLLIVSIYRVVEVFSGYRASTNAIVAFFVAMILFEVIAYGILLAMKIPEMINKHTHHNRHEDPEKRAMRNSESEYGASRNASMQDPSRDVSARH